MAIDKILIEKREDILRIAAKHGVGRIRVFGSSPGVRVGRKAIWTFWWK
jgi:hypothetical protein